MKNHSLPNKLLALVLTLTMAASMTACGESASTAAPGKENSNSAAGAILLSVNPEIEVEYDERGAVLEIEGINNWCRRFTRPVTLKTKWTAMQKIL